jgi:hypothetical protein
MQLAAANVDQFAGRRIFLRSLTLPGCLPDD